jgi:ferredoxin-NADP reductase
LALLTGNIFSYLASPKKKLLLKLKEKIQLTPTIYDFVFDTGNTMRFSPGQYLEWTVGHDHVDSRGNRRYFTIASSPTENNISMGVKFYEPASSFKRALIKMRPGDTLLAGQLAGDFLMPKNKKEKLVFIAGGIGITPFRSMLKYLVDKNEKRDVVVIYSNKTPDEFAYVEVFKEAIEKLGIRSIFTITDEKTAGQNWQGEVGRVTPEMLKKYIPDYRQRTFYVSGTHSMTSGMEDILGKLGVSKNKIVTDYFPGFV